MNISQRFTVAATGLALIAGAITPLTAQADFSISAPAQVYVGESIQVTLADCDPAAPASASLFNAATHERLGETDTLSDNSGIALLILPAQATPATYSVSATCAQGGKVLDVKPRTAEVVVAARSTVTAATTGSRPVGVATNIWGTASNAPHARVTVQVRIGNSWSTSRTGTTNANGFYAIPLTYGANAVGTYTYRVAVTYKGQTFYSPETTLTRTGVTVTAATAGSRPVGVATSIWGVADGAPKSKVAVQVRIGSKWVTSRTGTTKANGSYALPLTYGANKAGTYTFRVAVTHRGKTVYSPAVTLTRTAKTTAKKSATTKPKPVASKPTTPTKTTTTKKPTTTKPARTSAYYKNCSAVRAAGKAPLYRGQPGYGRHLDRDGDGVACE